MLKLEGAAGIEPALGVKDHPPHIMDSSRPFNIHAYKLFLLSLIASPFRVVGVLWRLVGSGFPYLWAAPNWTRTSDLLALLKFNPSIKSTEN